MGLLPEDNQIILNTQTLKPCTTYKMKIEEEHVQGKIHDELEAVEQACYKILNTERYENVIYSPNYGVELADLFGMPMPYVYPELPRRIEEALIQDDRITAVEDFDIAYDKLGNVTCNFTVISIYGELKLNKKVKIN